MATKKKQPPKKGKKGKKTGSAGIAVANHPKAQHQINVMKSYAGLAAFALAGYFAWKGGNAYLDVASRALLWGIATYVAVWAMAVQVWRQIAVAEVRAAEKRWKAAKEEQEEQVEKLRKVLEENNLPADGTGVPA
jgi:type VI protein secretion system component VasK